MQKEVVPDLSEFQHLPKFEDGRINYTGCKRCPVLNCVVTYNGEVLLLKRSDKVANYKGYWNFVAGFLDHPSIMFRKTNECFYHPKFEVTHDYDFYLNLLTSGKKLTNMPEALIKYRLQSEYHNSVKFKKQMKFAEIAQQFYNQRLSKGSDEYSSFDPEKLFQKS